MKCDVVANAMSTVSDMVNCRGIEQDTSAVSFGM